MPQVCPNVGAYFMNFTLPPTLQPTYGLLYYRRYFIGRGLVVYLCTYIRTYIDAESSYVGPDVGARMVVTLVLFLRLRLPCPIHSTFVGTHITGP